ncbi:hypothetical protein AM493_06400 [Flavobacterium akiainvivens]|uniref:Uncharacterized protein n=1 Tax=Flavobacterium akiainvivens TaxID=1202724 RepID=A0A0M8MHI2_9FLAO|nr:hypothetical protein [Flavobacterium akiainvivens]KOS05708.1 hypothetical protein AM493_06400 [Flavobacterium akiainvivens]SFQ37033.1 hypothetical protein SAMN05444144_103318 [Flavobacterium akiainvivens]
MPYYRALFRLPGGKELEATKGYVPDAFFDAIKNVTVNNLVVIYEDGFVLSNEMHDKLNIHNAFTSYAAVGISAPHGADTASGFADEMLTRLKEANHARPLEDHHNYQVYYMEFIENVADDD